MVIVGSDDDESDDDDDDEYARARADGSDDEEEGGSEDDGGGGKKKAKPGAGKGKAAAGGGKKGGAGGGKVQKKPEVRREGVRSQSVIIRGDWWMKGKESKGCMDCVQVDKVLEEVRKLMLEQARNSDRPVSVKELGITNVREVRTCQHKHSVLERHKYKTDAHPPSTRQSVMNRDRR